MKTKSPITIINFYQLLVNLFKNLPFLIVSKFSIIKDCMQYTKYPKLALKLRLRLSECSHWKCASTAKPANRFNLAPTPRLALFMTSSS